MLKYDEPLSIFAFDCPCVEEELEQVDIKHEGKVNINMWTDLV